MNNFISIKSFLLSKYFIILAAIIAYFSPLKSILIAAFVFASVDFIIGVIEAITKKTKASKWAKLKQKIFYFSLSVVGILMAFYFECLFLDFLNLQLSRFVAFIILSVDFWSIMKNISSLTGLNFDKESIYNLVAKHKQATGTTNQTN